jgi:UTP--glucose-1-phosphate uridylyltransferase
MSPLTNLTAAERADLDSLGFDADAFEQLAADFVADRLPTNRLPAVAAPDPSAFLPLPAAGTWQGDALRDAGTQALHGGQAALLLLNGGMATRFGGRVKGVVDALPGRSFLALQASRLRALSEQIGRPVPLILMNSRATDAKTRDHLAANDFFGLDPDSVHCFVQSAAPRLRPDGSLYRDADGAISAYGPGHGDLLPCLRRSGALQWAIDRGVTTLLMANVDNLGATLDPGLLGRMLAEGHDLLVEVVQKNPGDAGGAPAQVDGKVVIVEGFAFPEGFDQDSIPVFNTNTLWFRTEALQRELPLRWYVVHKKTGGEPVVQFERLVGQASWFLKTGYVRVDRSRFLPVKSPGDLQALQPALRKAFGVSLNVL